jgi:hypothetical protein
VVKVEAALRARELARGRGEALAANEEDAARAATVARIAQSGLHNAAFSDGALLELLRSLGAAEAAR